MNPVYTRLTRHRASLLDRSAIGQSHESRQRAAPASDSTVHATKVRGRRQEQVHRYDEPLSAAEHDTSTKMVEDADRVRHQEDQDEGLSDGELDAQEDGCNMSPRQSCSTGWRNFFPDNSSDESDGDTLDIDKIEDLLYLAECRLLEHEKALETVRLSSQTPESSSKLQTKSTLPKPYAPSSDKVLRPDESALVSSKMRALADKGRLVTPVSLISKQSKSKGSPPGLTTHFDLPRTVMTPELKRDMQLLSMRAVLDPKRMYKRQGKFKIPEYSQVGTIVEGPADFYGGRLNKKERDTSFVKETIKAEQQTGRFKRKYADLQGKQRSGKKASWNARVAKRRRH